MDNNRRRLLASLPVAALAGAVPLRAAETAPPVQAQPAPALVAYAFLRPDEAAFVEALADHMVPADELTPAGNELGIPVCIDGALRSAWGEGDRLYLQGPFAEGTSNQGYQLPLTPAQLFRSGTAAFDRWCARQLGAPFAQLDGAKREQALLALRDGHADLIEGPPAGWYFRLLYDLVMEGLFADPNYGGNRGKAGWKLIGYPGVIQANRLKIRQFHNRAYVAEPLSIADVGGRE